MGWLDPDTYEDGYICDNCGSQISDQSYAHTVIDKYCNDCPEMCYEPHSKVFGQCECEEENA